MFFDKTDLALYFKNNIYIFYMFEITKALYNILQDKLVRITQS